MFTLFKRFIREEDGQDFAYHYIFITMCIAGYISGIRV